MIYKIEQDNEWYNVVVIKTNKVEDGFNNREDAERYMAHLEAEDGKHVTKPWSPNLGKLFGDRF